EEDTPTPNIITGDLFDINIDTKSVIFHFDKIYAFLINNKFSINQISMIYATYSNYLDSILDGTYSYDKYKKLFIRIIRPDEFSYYSTIGEDDDFSPYFLSIYGLRKKTSDEIINTPTPAPTSISITITQN